MFLRVLVLAHLGGPRQMAVEQLLLTNVSGATANLQTFTLSLLPPGLLLHSGPKK